MTQDNELTSSDEEERLAKKEIKVRSDKRVTENVEEVMGDKFTPAQLQQIKDLMLATNYRNSTLPTAGTLMVEPPSKWPRDAKGRFIDDTMEGLSANSQVIRSQLINTQFHQLRKKYSPGSSAKDRKESITEFLEGINMSQEKTKLSRKEFRDILPTLFGGQAYIKVKNMIKNGRTLREVYRSLIDSYNTEESEIVARNKLANLKASDFDSLSNLNDEVSRLANVIANNRMSPEARDLVRTELITNNLLRLIPPEMKTVIEGEISHFKMASYGQDLTAEDLFLILLKYRNGLDEYYFKNYKNRRSKKEVNAVQIDSPPEGAENKASESKKSNSKKKKKNKKSEEVKVNAVKDETEKKSMNKDSKNYKKKGNSREEYCNLCDNKSHSVDNCNLFPKWMRQITQERCKKCTLKGYHLEKYCPAVRFASISSSTSQ